MSDHIMVEAAARAWIAAEGEYDPDDWETEWAPGELRLLTAAIAAALAVAPTVSLMDDISPKAVLACGVASPWFVVRVSDCEAQGCSGPHRTLLLGRAVEETTDAE